MAGRSTTAATRTRVRALSGRASRASGNGGVGGIKSINKAVAILREIHAASRPLRVSELSKLLGLSPSVVSRIVSTLAKGGLLDHDEETSRIQLGLGLAVLGHSALGRRKLDLIAIPVMAKLTEDFREYISLSRLVEGRVVMMRGAPVEVMHRDTFLTTVVPVHASAPGKLLAAWQPEESLVALLEQHGMDAYTPRTITSVRQFKDELRKIRRERFALDDEELVPGFRHVAAPVFDQDGTVVAALSAGGPRAKLNAEEIAKLRAALTTAGTQISRQLGYPTAAPRP